MSGPKVVHIVTREELEAICRREIAIATAAAEELLRAYRRAGKHNAAADRAISEGIERLKSLIERERFEEVQKQAPQIAAFMRDEADQITREAISAAERSRQRRRNLAESAESLIRALAAAGVRVPPELSSIPAKAETASESDEAALRAILDAGLRDLAAVGSEGTEIIGADAKNLAARLGKSEDALTLEAWVVANASKDPAHSRLDAALGSIEALGNAELVERYQIRARSLLKASSEKRALLLDSLILEASRDARRLRENVAHRARLVEAAAALSGIGTERALTYATVLGRAAESGTYETANDLLREAALIAEQEMSSIAATARRKAVLGGLSALGYEVREGMATAWVRDGRLVVRKPGATDYGVELGAPNDVSRLQIRVVGSDRPLMPRDKDRDRDQEVAWCSEFKDLQRLVDAAGGALNIERAVEVGAQAVKTIRFDDASKAELREGKTSRLQRSAD